MGSLSKAFIYTTLIILLPLIVIFISEITAISYYNPEGKFKTYEGAVASGRHFTSIEKIIINGKAYKIATLEYHNIFTLRSGPAQYVFDENGNLIDWTWDSGDDPRFVKKWYRN
jgi:hypothetical protein